MAKSIPMEVALPELPRAEKGSILGLPVIFEYRKGDYKACKEGYDTPGYYMHADYGYFVDTESNEEGEGLDFFLGEDLLSPNIYILTIGDEARPFEEHKVLVGFSDLNQAKGFCSAQYDWRCQGELMIISPQDLQEWVVAQRLKARRTARMKKEEQPRLTVPVSKDG